MDIKIEFTLNKDLFDQEYKRLSQERRKRFEMDSNIIFLQFRIILSYVVKHECKKLSSSTNTSRISLEGAQIESILKDIYVVRKKMDAYEDIMNGSLQIEIRDDFYATLRGIDYLHYCVSDLFNLSLQSERKDSLLPSLVSSSLEIILHIKENMSEQNRKKSLASICNCIKLILDYLTSPTQNVNTIMEFLKNLKETMPGDPLFSNKEIIENPDNFKKGLFGNWF